MPAKVRRWLKVVFAGEPECKCCGDPYCKKHKKHYAECPCPGPTQDDLFEYRTRNGVLLARPKP